MFLLLRPLFWEIDEFYSAIFKHHMPHLLDILSFIPLWLYVIHFAHKFFLSPKIFVYIFRGKKIYCFPLDLHRHSSLMIINSVCYDECQSNYGNFRSSYIFCSHKHSFFPRFSKTIYQKNWVNSKYMECDATWMQTNRTASLLIYIQF